MLLSAYCLACAYLPAQFEVLSNFVTKNYETTENRIRKAGMVYPISALEAAQKHIEHSFEDKWMYARVCSNCNML